MGDEAEAERIQRCVIAMAQTRGDAALLAQARCSLGASLTRQGRHAEARPLLEHAVDAARSLPARPALRVTTVVALAELESVSGPPAAARPLFEEALRLARACGDRMAMLEALLGLCGLAAGPEASQPPQRPLQLQRLQQAQAIADELQSPPAQRQVQAARAALPAES